MPFTRKLPIHRLLGHSPKKKDNSPITLDNLAGSKNVGNFIDSCFCIGQAKTDSDEKRYIKQLKNRSSQIILNEEHVLVCSIEKGEDNFLYFKEEGYAREKDLIKGTCNITSEKEKVYQLYKEHKSYRKVAMDIVFPCFLFAVGMSIPYAIERRYAKGFSAESTLGHILSRTFALLRKLRNRLRRKSVK